MLKKHFLLLPEIIPGQIEIIPKENPKINIGIISQNSRKCFLKILMDGSDGSVQIKTLLSINSNYLLKIKNTNNKYLKILLIGDSCFRKF